MLHNLDLKPRYVTGLDDIAADFLVPSLEVSDRYDRAVGYFASSVLSSTWKGVRSLHLRRGKMRVVCSPIFSRQDVSALSDLYGKYDEQTAIEAVRRDFEAMLSNSVRFMAAKAMAGLIAAGTLEIRIAVLAPAKSPAVVTRMFHQKTGIIEDNEGNSVAFTGSMNETWSGTDPSGNMESIHVFCSWKGPLEEQRAELERVDFEKLWTNSQPGVDVIEMPRALKERILIEAPDTEGLVSILDDLANGEDSQQIRTQSQLRLREHQESVLEDWERNGFRGIVKHATGSGKTITALSAIRLSQAATSSFLIVVPSEILLRQWEREVDRHLPNLAVMLCGSGHSRWKRPNELEKWTQDSDKVRLVIAVLPTAASTQFLNRLQTGQHLTLIVDEVHRTGARDARRLLSLDAGRVLGLSATPERAGDAEGTGAILEYFGSILKPEYGIFHAIQDGYLSPYVYYPEIVTLTEDEQTEWNGYSQRIARLLAGKPDSATMQNDLQMLLIRRSRIAKGAAGKVQLARDVVTRSFSPGQKWIVYCDSSNQMTAVQQELRDQGIDSYIYYSEMPANKEATLDYFESVGGVLVSIKCLDEGVDIPGATHALILASSRNPREFIQRRGRVLRLHPGKEKATIFDALVVPNQNAASDVTTTGPLLGELARSIEFGRYALNSTVVHRLASLGILHGATLDDLATIGFETISEEED